MKMYEVTLFGGPLDGADIGLGFPFDHVDSIDLPLVRPMTAKPVGDKTELSATPLILVTYKKLDGRFTYAGTRER